MKKTHLAWIFTGNNYFQSIVPHFFLLKKLSENFQKIYLINLVNLKLFKDIRSVSNELEMSEEDKKFYTFGNNVEIFEPKNKSEFSNFMKYKNIVAINNIGRYLTEIPNHFLLAKHKIKQVQVSFVGNIQHDQMQYRNFFKAIIYFINKNISYKLITLLSNLSLIPKIDIRFTSINRLVKNPSPIRKLIELFNIPYIKKYELINSRSYDMAMEDKNSLSEEKIVFLDFMVNNGEQVAIRGNLPKDDYKSHYKSLIKILKKIELLLEKKLIICLHPRDNFTEKKNIFKDFEVIQFKTRENILDSFCVIFFDSSAIVDAIILKKRIITLHSNYLGKVMKDGSDRYKNEIGILQLNIEDDAKINDKNSFLNILNDNLKNYDNYIKKNIKPDTDELGYNKIIRILKEKYFIS
jgi:hypothetical protein